MIDNLTSFFGGTGSIFLGFFIVVLFLGIGGGVVYYVFQQRLFNKVVLVRTIIDGNKGKPFFDVAKRVADKDGVFWKFKKLKLLLEAPPEECIENNSKGKEFVQLFITQQDQPIWVKPQLPEKDMKQTGFKYIDTSSRQSYANQYKKSQKYGIGGFGAFIEKYGAIMAVGSVMVLILGIFMFFFGDTLVPIQNLSDSLTQVSSDNKEIAQMLRDIVLEQASREVPN